MALVYQKTRAETVCSLGQNVFVLLNDKSRMKGDLHVRFREKFEVKVLLLTRLRGREIYLNFPPTRFFCGPGQELYPCRRKFWGKAMCRRRCAPGVRERPPLRCERKETA